MKPHSEPGAWGSSQWGKWAEDLALKHLQSCGLVHVQSHFHAREGEIDHIFWEGETLLLIEVRLRKKGALVSALESVSKSKRQKLRKAAEAYLDQFAVEPVVRFDVFAVEKGDQSAKSLWLKDAFDLEDV